MDKNIVFWSFIVVTCLTMLIGNLYIEGKDTYSYNPTNYNYTNPYKPQFDYCKRLDISMDPIIRMECLGFKRG